MVSFVISKDHPGKKLPYKNQKAIGFSGHFGAADGANLRVFSETLGVGVAADLSAGALHAHPAPRRNGRPEDDRWDRWDCWFQNKTWSEKVATNI